MKRILCAIILPVIFAGSLSSPAVAGTKAFDPDFTVTKVDFAADHGMPFNAAGPFLLRLDEARGRLIAANTLSSSISIIDYASGRVTNIPLGGRGFQHLKSECMTHSATTGEICLVGRNCFYIVSPDAGTARMIQTKRQFESIAVDEATGNIFLAGRESSKLGFYDASSGKMKMLDWVEREEPLSNLNATPPPPVRKVVADAALKAVIAVDGLDPALSLFDGATGRKISSRQLALSSGGRWHLGGYDEARQRLFIVTETAKRQVVEAASIDVAGRSDTVVRLPGYTEGVGILYNKAREEVYIPYDNHPSVHVVDFSRGGEISEIMIPAYGNDGSALDASNGILYIASWAFGEIDVVDLAQRKLVKRVPGVGIIPHMFSMVFNPADGLLYFPKGASAVNGTFGAAVTFFDPATERTGRIRTGWAPIDLIEVETRGSFLVFNSEDAFAEVRPGGGYETHALPFDYPVRAEKGPGGDIMLSYGPHQSYWPVVYIWDAKNGILSIDKDDLSFYDRRIPRQAHELVFDPDGALYFTQNNWGKEEQFIGRMRDGVRLFSIDDRIRLGEDVEREITQRILRGDPGNGLLYLVKAGERDEDQSVLQVVDPDSSKVIARVEVGVTATDLAFDEENIYVTGFDSDRVAVVGKKDWTVGGVVTSAQPLRLCAVNGAVYAICHAGNTLERIAGGASRKWKLPFGERPDNIFAFGKDLVITGFSGGALHLMRFDPERERFTLIHREDYPYGDTSMDSGNVSFYMRGQYGDVLFSLTRGKTGSGGGLWITDFLSGKLFIIQRKADREG